MYFHRHLLELQVRHLLLVCDTENFQVHQLDVSLVRQLLVRQLDEKFVVVQQNLDEQNLVLHLTLADAHQGEVVVVMVAVALHC
jgi:hypothetical protein